MWNTKSDTDHKAEDCKALRTDIFRHNLPEMSAEVAWDRMMKAANERDHDDFEEAFFCYAKAQLMAGDPIDLTDLETGFREQNLNFFLIARVR